MSLINDALRRASGAARGGSAPPPPPPTPAAPPFSAPVPAPVSAFAPPPPLALPVSDEEGADPGASRSTKMQVALGLLLCVTVMGVALMNHWSKKNQDNAVDMSGKMGKKAIVPNAAETRAKLATNTPATNPVPVAVAPVAPIPATTAPPAVVAAPQPPPKFPALKLQGIFYRPADPSVMINGKTLFLDDQIQGVTVADIQPATVTLVLSGQTNILTLR
jgi:hypothetical protein